MSNSVFTLPEHTFLIEFEYWSLFYKNLPFLCGIFGILFSVLLNTLLRYKLFSIKLSRFGYYIYLFFNRKWYFDLIYNHYILNIFLDIGYQITFKLIDKGVLELIGPQGLYLVFHRASNFVTSFQSGVIYNYVLIIFISLLLFLGFVLFSYYIPTISLFFVKIILFFVTIFLLSVYIDK